MNEVDAYSRLAGVYDDIVVDLCHDQWAAYLHELWGWDETPVLTVLDVCCGTGLMAAELVRLGYRVVGVDSSPAMLARARRRVGPELVLAQQTLPDLRIEGTFDAAVSTFDALNYLTPDELHPTMAAIASRLRPAGWLVFDLHTDAMMNMAVTHPVVEGEADRKRFTIRNIVDVGARTCDTWIDVIDISGADAFTEHHQQYFPSDVQVRSALAQAGFGVVAVTSEYTYQPADASTLRATWIARLSSAR